MEGKHCFYKPVDEENKFQSAYRAYRELKRLLQPEEIKESQHLHHKMEFADFNLLHVQFLLNKDFKSREKEDTYDPEISINYVITKKPGKWLYWQE